MMMECWCHLLEIGYRPAANPQQGELNNILGLLLANLAKKTKEEDICSFCEIAGVSTNC